MRIVENSLRSDESHVKPEGKAMHVSSSPGLELERNINPIGMEGKTLRYKQLDMDMDYLCSSFSWAEAKSVVWPMGRDMSIRMSNVSTIGCLKYSAIASGCKTDTSTPWNELCCLKRGREYSESMLVAQLLEPGDNTDTRSHTRSMSCPSAPDRVPRPRTELRTVSLVLGTSYLCKERRVRC